jgi:hypothetical protein
MRIFSLPHPHQHLLFDFSKFKKERKEGRQKKERMNLGPKLLLWKRDYTYKVPISK